MIELSNGFARFRIYRCWSKCRISADHFSNHDSLIDLFVRLFGCSSNSNLKEWSGVKRLISTEIYYDLDFGIRCQAWIRYKHDRYKQIDIDEPYQLMKQVTCLSCSFVMNNQHKQWWNNNEEMQAERWCFSKFEIFMARCLWLLEFINAKFGLFVTANLLFLPELSITITEIVFK